VASLQVIVRSQTGFALPSPLLLDTIELTFDDGSHTLLPVGRGADGWHLLPESSVGAPELVDGRRVRAFRPTGSIYHKVEWTVTPPQSARPARARVRYQYTGTDVAEFRVFTSDRQVLVAGDLPAGDGWQEAVFARGAAPQVLDVQKQIDYGSGRVRITAVEFSDADGSPIVQIAHGEALTVRVRAEVAPDLQDRHVTFVVVFWRQGSSCLAVTHRSSLLLPDADQCVIQVTLDPVRLGSGLWYVNVGIGAPGLYEQPTIVYFATDASWHHLLAGRFELRVVSISHVDAIHFVVHPATVECRPVGAGVPSAT
jgi:Wzt C-terminal domain